MVCDVAYILNGDVFTHLQHERLVTDDDTYGVVAVQTFAVSQPPYTQDLQANTCTQEY